MKNIFIISNSFSARTILYQIDYLLNFEIGRIYLFQENHEYSEVYGIHSNIELVMHEDIDKFVSESDIVLILQDKYIPQRLIEHIKHIVSKENKLIIIDNPWCEEHLTENAFAMDIQCDTTPNILQIVFGEYTQHYCTEILLNKILSIEKIPFFQEFSTETTTLIEQLSNYGIINQKIILAKQNKINNYAVVVKSLYVNQYKTFSKNKDFIETMKMLSPSYIVMNISSNCVNYDVIKDVFTYKHNKSIDIIVKSPYIETTLTKSHCGTYCDMLDADLAETYTPTSNHLEKQLEMDLLAKISMPKDIVIL